MPRLITLKEYETLTPSEKGYVVYAQAELPGSELKDHQTNPYRFGSDKWKQFAEGQFQACLDAQDSEE